MSFANEADRPLNIQNLKTKYDQYSMTLNDLRDPNNPSYTNSQLVKGVESANGNSSLLKEYYVQQGADLKEQLIQIITSNRQSGNLEKATFADVEIKESSDEEESPIDSIPVTREQLLPHHTLTTDVTQASLSNHPFDSSFNYLEEGLYKRDDIQIKQSNMTLFQKRLLLQKQTDYFDINGDVKLDAPTLRHIPQPFQQSPATSYGENQVTTFVPASLWKIDNSNTARHIRVEINKVRFTSHELSSDQDLLSTQLKQLYDSYMNDIQFPKTEYFEQKVQALREELKRRPEKEQDLLRQIIECHESRDIEEKKMGEKRDALLECWHMLKDARDKSKPTTKICLKWKARKFTEAEKEEETQLFETTLKARAKEQQRYYSLLTGEKKKTKAILEELKTKHEEMGLRMPGDTKWIPVLDEAPKALLKDLSESEQKRYEYLENTRISVVFWMGVYEVRSDEVPISSDFVAKTDVGCHAVVLHPPPGIKIHIFESGNQKRHELATVTLPVFNGEPPVFNEYEFTSSTPLPNGRMVQGYIEGRCFIEPDPESLETITKDTRYKYLGNLKNGRKVPIKMSNKMINELIEKHDPNDPYLTVAIVTMKAHERNEKSEISFALDRDKEATLFASMAASDIWKQIPNRAYDLIRPNETTTKSVNIEEETPKLFDVVTQPPSFSFSSLFNSFIGLFKKKKTRSVILENQNGSDRIDESSTILLHFHQLLLSSLRYPEHKITNIPAKSSTKQNIFIRVSLQGVEHATMTIQGNNSDFNKQIELKLVQEGAPIPNYKQIESKLIRIDLFDQYSEDENQFLGSLHISLRCIFVNERISGVYPITMPPFMMDHIVENLNSQLALSIKLKPKLILEKLGLPSPVAETDEINKRAHQIWTDLNYEMPERNYSILVMTNEGKSVLPCRLITPQRMPEIKDFSQLLTFVSMIPTNSTIDNSKSHVYWCTSSEILKNNWGTNIEHALLFCNLLLGQKVDAYVVIGKDMISGYNAYVLVVENNPNYDPERAAKLKKNKEPIKEDDNRINQFNRTLFNPTDGTIYQINSQHITLIDVATVFNNTNIWFNRQSNQIPVYSLDWDLTNNTKWTPFFNEKFTFVDFNGIKQPEDLPITEANEELALPIRKKVSKIVKSAVSTLRPGTKWVKTIKPYIRSLLIAKNKNQIESPDFDDGSFKELLDKTKREFRDYRIVGSPFFVSYVYDEEANDDILNNEVFDEIKKRDICNCKPAIDLAEEDENENEEEDVLFSHVVEVKPFPNNIYAIWIFLVALHPTEVAVEHESEPIHQENDEENKSSNTSSAHESNESPNNQIQDDEHTDDSSSNQVPVQKQNDSPPPSDEPIEEEEYDETDDDYQVQAQSKQAAIDLPKEEKQSDDNDSDRSVSSDSSANEVKQNSPKHTSSEKAESPIQSKRSSSSEKIVQQNSSSSSSSSPAKEAKEASSKSSSLAKDESPTKMSSSEKVQQSKDDSQSSDSGSANMKKVLMLGEVLADAGKDDEKKSADNNSKQQSSNDNNSSSDENEPLTKSSSVKNEKTLSSSKGQEEQSKQPLRDIKEIIKSRIQLSDSDDSSDIILTKSSSRKKIGQSETMKQTNLKRPISASRKKKNDDDDSGADISSPIMKTHRRGKSRQQPKKQAPAPKLEYVSDSDE